VFLTLGVVNSGPRVDAPAPLITVNNQRDFQLSCFLFLTCPAEDPLNSLMSSCTRVATICSSSSFSESACVFHGLRIDLPLGLSDWLRGRSLTRTCLVGFPLPVLWALEQSGQETEVKVRHLCQL
jgi:hypothetical protein